MSTNLTGVDSPNLQIALGRIAGYDRLAAFGLTNGLTSGTTVVVSTTATVIDWPTIATVLDIVSTDAGDTPTAAGVGTVTISGVDGSFAEIQELVVLNGTTIVNTSNSFLSFRIQKILIASSFKTTKRTFMFLEFPGICIMVS